MRIEDFKEHKCPKIPERYSVETAISNSGKSEWVWSVINHDCFDNFVYGIFYCPFCGQELGSAEPDMGTWKEDSLKHKYAAIPEEPPRYKKKKKKNRPKKANHKHEYRNCVIKYKFPDNWTIGRTEDGWTTTFASYCPVCGKIGWAQEDNVLAKLCPHIYISHFFWASNRASEEERKIFDKYVEEHYPIFVIEDFFDSRLSGQIFLDNEQLNSVK